MASSTDRVRAVIVPALETHGYDLEDLAVTAAGRRRLVRIAVDRDGGLTLDDAAELSRALSDALDAEDSMGHTAYVLEVTSRGVDRPLTLPRHWRRNVGRLVSVSFTDETVTDLVGRIASSTDSDVVLDVEGDDQRSVAFESIARAIVQVEFNRKDMAVLEAAVDDTADEDDDN